MNRIFSACIDIAASLIFLIPVFAICGRLIFHKVKHTAIYLLFACYLTAVMSLVGLPNVTYMRVDFTINLIPFVDMIPDFKNALLNVLLFVPMGFLLPILWERYRNRKNTAIVCLCVTCIIEILQVFTFRATDINDVITNVSGGMIGYFAAKRMTKDFSKLVCTETKNHELYIVFAVSFLGMFFVVPFVSGLL